MARKKPKRRWMGLLRRGLLLLLLLGVGLQVWYLGHILWWKGHNPESTAFMEEGLSRLQEKNPAAQIKHSWLPYSQLATNLKRAVVAAEDSHFSDHAGFDRDGLEAAIEKNWKQKRFAAGGSTISQQLSKNLLLSPSKNPLRKVQEALITVMLEKTWDKQRILEVYLNVIEWGAGVYGAQAAAQHYFRHEASQLSVEEAAFLAAVIPSPRYYDAHRSSKSLLRRSQRIAEQINLANIP